MDEQQVAHLARHEAALAAFARAEASASRTLTSEASEDTGWFAYVPLNGPPPADDARYRFIDATPVGHTVSVVAR
jgi:hypothetical protein